MANPPEIVANIMLAGEVWTPTGVPLSNQPGLYSLRGIGVNTWKAGESGKARVKFVACYTIHLRQTRMGTHPVGMFIEDQNGVRVKAWDVFLMEVSQAHHDWTGVSQFETTLPVGEYLLRLTVDGYPYAVTALYVASGGEPAE